MENLQKMVDHTQSFLKRYEEDSEKTRARLDRLEESTRLAHQKMQELIDRGASRE